MQAAEAGLAAVDAANAKVTIVDDFVGTVRRVAKDPDYGTDRGPGVVAARTIVTADGPVIVINAPLVRARDAALIERLFAHEGGHVHIGNRREDAVGRRHLVDSPAEWQLLNAGLVVLDEFRCERTLHEVGYPADEVGTMEDLGNSMHTLNCEIMLATTTDQSVRQMMVAVFASYQWFAKRLACVMANNPGVDIPSMSAFSQFARENWDDYAGDHWARRAAFYADIPGATTAMTSAELDQVLGEVVSVEAHLLHEIGFRLSNERGQLTFRRIGSTERFNRRWQRAAAELQASA